MVRLTVRLPDDLHAELVAEAAREERSLNQVVVRRLRAPGYVMREMAQPAELVKPVYVPDGDEDLDPIEAAKRASAAEREAHRLRKAAEVVALEAAGEPVERVNE